MSSVLHTASNNEYRYACVAFSSIRESEQFELVFFQNVTYPQLHKDFAKHLVLGFNGFFAVTFLLKILMTGIQNGIIIWDILFILIANVYQFTNLSLFFRVNLS